MPLSMPVDSESRVRLCVPADTVRVSDKVRVQLHAVVHTHIASQRGEHNSVRKMGASESGEKATQTY
jgi:hypothetical protein